MTATYTFGALSKALQPKQSDGEKRVDDELGNLFRINHEENEKKIKNATPVYITKQEPQLRKADTDEKQPEKKRRNKRKFEDDLEEERMKEPKFYQKDPSEDERTVFVGNLPNTIDKKNILKLFGKCGEIESVRIRSVAVADPKAPRKFAVIKKDFNKNRSNVNAYVKFVTSDEAKSSLKLNGQVVSGYHIRVDLESQSKDHDNSKSVFLGNLSFKLEEDAVYAHFNDCGEIEGVRLIRNSETGIGKGFGYVSFQTKHSVELALHLDGTNLMGRAIRVKRAVKNAKKLIKNVDKKVKRKEANQEKRSQKKFLDKYLKKSPKLKNKKNKSKKQKTNKK